MPEPLNLDMLSICAYADEAHARERELWRGFLSYALPVVMSLSGEEVEHCLAESIVYKLTELTVRGGPDVDVHESMRCISMLLATEIGVTPEFAIASFFDGELPTKLHRIGKPSRLKQRKESRHEDALIAGWLEHLASLQKDRGFLNKVEKWKTWLYPMHKGKTG